MTRKQRKMAEAAPRKNVLAFCGKAIGVPIIIVALQWLAMSRSNSAPAAEFFSDLPTSRDVAVRGARGTCTDSSEPLRAGPAFRCIV